MEVIRISPEEYRQLFCSPRIVYDSVAFSQLNAHKCEALHCLLFADGGRPRLGLVAGERGGGLAAPFSAPFAALECNSDQRVEHVEEAVRLLASYASGFPGGMRLRLPPLFYDCSMISKTVCALSGLQGLTDSYCDWNYHYPMERFPQYEGWLSRQARNKHRHAMESDFRVEVFSGRDEGGVRRCYDVIKANREWKGYPLRMTADEVVATVKIVPAEFLVMSLGGVDIAAAQVFFPCKDVAQVIYWGDRPGYEHLRPMNRLPYELFSRLAGRVRVVDIGPSSEDGVPNAGLCEFKESIGCVCTPKMTFFLK